MCPEERRICKALDEASLRDHQFFARTPTNFSADGDGEELQLQPLELETRSHEGESEPGHSLDD